MEIVLLIVLVLQPCLGQNWMWEGGAVPTTTTTTTRTTTTTASTTINYNIGPIIAPASVSNCTCVESYRCDAADIHQFGNGMIDPRRLCISGDVCCTKPKPATTVAPATTVKPTSAPLTGCGVANPEGIGLTRVTSDTLTAYGEFPWMTAVLENVGGGRLFICGGTLIHPRAVLTAAHCLQNKAQENIVVRLGEWDAASTNELYPTQEITALKVILHPEFYAGALFNDVAVIILSSDADTSRPNIRFSCLPSASDQYHRDKCISLGWGKQNFNDPGFSAILKKVLVPVVQHGDCQTTLQGTRLGKTFRLHEKFMCAGKNGADACTGDGGGPLMCPLSNQPKRFIQVGVTSWGIGCGTSPGVYSDLTQLEPWIQSTLNSNT